LASGIPGLIWVFQKGEESGMAGKFVVYKGKDGQDYFRLKAGNGETILSSEGYKARKSCENGIESVRKNSQDESRFEVRTAKDGREYFILKAGNGQEIGRSQMYKSSSGCRNGMKSVARNAVDARVVEE
jgi:uncharacterized protein YegP (UPF0339 family)